MDPHPDFLPTGEPVVNQRRSFGEVPSHERLGIGILGLHEGFTLLVGLRASTMCRAVAACDLDAAKRAQAAASAPGIVVTDSYESMLARDDVHIVAIYTPDHLHAEHILRAFEAGKHVICTKPLINDARHGSQLKEAAERSGRRLQVGQSTRFYEPFQRQRELFESGAMGDVEVLDAHYVHRMDWWYRKSPWTLGHTHWAYLGLSHPIDLVRWYLGPIQEVHAFGSRTSMAVEHGMESPDAIVVNLRSCDGRVARVMGNFGMHELPAARSLIECFLMGSHGTSLARYPDLRFSYLLDGGAQVEEDYSESMAGYHYRHELKGMHYGEFCSYADYFASKLLSGEPNSPDLDEGLETLSVMDAVVRSLEAGQTVHVTSEPHERVNTIR